MFEQHHKTNNSFFANKGEWSEFYALCKLVLNGKVKVIDRDIEAPDERPLHSVQKDGVLYLFLNNNEKGIECKIKETSFYIDKEQILLKNGTAELFRRIKNKGTLNDKKTNGSFEIDCAHDLANSLHINISKTRSDQKADLTIKFKYNDIGSAPKPHDVSIKSWIGANPTLFNASKQSSRLVFEVLSTLPTDQILSIKSKNIDSVTTREALQEAKKLGCSFNFVCYSKNEMKKNIANFAGEEIISKIVLQHFLRADGVSSTSEYLSRTLENEYPSFEHTWMTFLERCAFGLTAGKIYNEAENIADNILIVDNQGELFCVIGRGRLRNLLYRLSEIDTPSTKRHDYGYFYEKEGKIYIDLNFQVRLILKNNFHHLL